jgi:hypothetical protein
MNRDPDRHNRKAQGSGQHFPAGMAMLALIVLIFFSVPASWARQSAPARNASPEQTLIGALTAACRQNSQQFVPFLLSASGRMFMALPQDEQKTFLKRFSLTSLPGDPRTLLDANGRMVVQCRTPAETVTFGLSPAQIDRNVAFITVAVNDEQATQFGLVRQPDGWRLYSLGLLVINVPALVKQWQDAEMQANEQECMSDLLGIAEALKTYHTAFGQWPDTLEQLGPSAASSKPSPERAQLLTKQAASGIINGYRFRYRVVTGTRGQIEGFELGAVPVQYDKTGRKSFFLDQKGKIHGADNRGGPATDADPILQPPSQSSS